MLKRVGCWIISLRVMVIFLILILEISDSGFSQISMVDDLGRTVILPSHAQRIVSLAPSITETIFAVGAGDAVVGVTDYCNYPDEAKKKQRVGGVVNPSIETIVSLKPDLIVLSMEGNVREDFKKLTSFGIPVFITNPRNLRGIYTSIEQLGTLTGRKESAGRLVKSLRLRVDSIRAIVSVEKKQSVMVFVSLQPIIVVGQNTFFAELIELAGGTNVTKKGASTYPTYSREAVLKTNPDVLIFMSDVLANPADLVTLFPEWTKLKAYRQKKIFRINADIVSRPGPRAVDGLEALHNLIKH